MVKRYTDISQNRTTRQAFKDTAGYMALDECLSYWGLYLDDVLGDILKDPAVGKIASPLLSMPSTVLKFTGHLDNELIHNNSIPVAARNAAIRTLFELGVENVIAQYCPKVFVALTASRVAGHMGAYLDDVAHGSNPIFDQLNKSSIGQFLVTGIRGEIEGYSNSMHLLSLPSAALDEINTFCENVFIDGIDTVHNVLPKPGYLSASLSAGLPFQAPPSRDMYATSYRTVPIMPTFNSDFSLNQIVKTPDYSSPKVSYVSYYDLDRMVSPRFFEQPKFFDTPAEDSLAWNKSSIYQQPPAPNITGLSPAVDDKTSRPRPTIADRIKLDGFVDNAGVLGLAASFTLSSGVALSFGVNSSGGFALGASIPLSEAACGAIATGLVGAAVAVAAYVATDEIIARLSNSHIDVRDMTETELRESICKLNEALSASAYPLRYKDFDSDTQASIRQSLNEQFRLFLSADDHQRSINRESGCLSKHFTAESRGRSKESQQGCVREAKSQIGKISDAISGSLARNSYEIAQQLGSSNISPEDVANYRLHCAQTRNKLSTASSFDIERAQATLDAFKCPTQSNATDIEQAMRGNYQPVLQKRLDAVSQYDVEHLKRENQGYAWGLIGSGISNAAGISSDKESDTTFMLLTKQLLLSGACVDPKVAIKYSNLNRKQKNFDEAYYGAVQALRLCPENKKLNYNAGMAAYRKYCADMKQGAKDSDPVIHETLTHVIRHLSGAQGLEDNDKEIKRLVILVSLNSKVGLSSDVIKCADEFLNLNGYSSDLEILITTMKAEAHLKTGTIAEMEDSIVVLKSALDSGDVHEKRTEQISNILSEYENLKLQHAVDLDLSSAKIALIQHKLQDAVIHLEHALKLDASRSDILLSLAGLYVQQNKHAKAADLYERYLLQSPNDLDAMIACGEVYLAANNALRAQDKFSTVLSIVSEKGAVTNEKLQHVLRLQGFVQYQLGKFQNAAGHFANYLNNNANDHSVTLFYGLSLIKLGSFVKAKQWLEPMLSKDVNEPMLYFAMAKIYLKEGMIKKGREMLDKGIKSAEQNDKAFVDGEFVTELLSEYAAHDTESLWHKIDVGVSVGCDVLTFVTRCVKLYQSFVCVRMANDFYKEVVNASCYQSPDRIYGLHMPESYKTASVMQHAPNYFLNQRRRHEELTSNSTFKCQQRSRYLDGKSSPSEFQAASARKKPSPTFFETPAESLVANKLIADCSGKGSYVISSSDRKVGTQSEYYKLQQQRYSEKMESQFLL